MKSTDTKINYLILIISILFSAWMLYFIDQYHPCYGRHRKHIAVFGAEK